MGAIARPVLASEISEETRNRFIEKIEFCEDGCWLWKAATKPNGYGIFCIKPRVFNAHRLSFALQNGETPGGRAVIDHLCRNRACVNPLHLELVDRRENLLRGDTLVAKNHAKQRCPQCDSEFSVAKSHKTGRTTRFCRDCVNRKARQRRACLAE